MIVARFKVRCVPDKTEEMVQAMRAVVAPSRALPGVIHFDVARDVTDTDSLIATEVFADRVALERQNAQPEVAEKGVYVGMLYIGAAIAILPEP